MSESSSVRGRPNRTTCQETGRHLVNPRDTKRALTTDHVKQPTREHTPASTTSDEDSGRIGAIGLVCSILGVITCGLWLLSIPGLVLSIIAMRRRGSVKAKAGVVLGAIGVCEFVLAVPLIMGLLLPSLATARHAVLMEKNANQMSQIHKAMMEFSDSDSNGFLPAPGRINKSKDPHLPHHVDPWGSPYRVDPSPVGKASPVVKSDGPDRVPDTEDDTRHPPA